MAHRDLTHESKTRFLKDDIVAISKMLDTGLSIKTVARQYNASIQDIKNVKLHLISKG